MGIDPEIAAAIAEKLGLELQIEDMEFSSTLTAVQSGKAPACLLFSKEIDSLAAAGAVLADVWSENAKMPTVDRLGDEFLDYVQDGDRITVHADGRVTVERDETEKRRS